MKAVVAPLNQEKALVGAFSVITNFRMELLKHYYLLIYTTDIYLNILFFPSNSYSLL